MSIPADDDPVAQVINEAEMAAWSAFVTTQPIHFSVHTKVVVANTRPAPGDDPEPEIHGPVAVIEATGYSVIPDGDGAAEESTVRVAIPGRDLRKLARTLVTADRWIEDHP